MYPQKKHQIKAKHEGVTIKIITSFTTEIDGSGNDTSLCMSIITFETETAYDTCYEI
jgi:hypothetical protein